MDKGTVCIFHEYCTDCPLRGECTTRKAFYNEDLFIKSLVLSLIPFYDDNPHTSELVDKFLLSIIEKRKKELELHPTYSLD